MVRRMVDTLELSILPSPPPTSQLAPLLREDHRPGARYRSLLTRPTSGKGEGGLGHAGAKVQCLLPHPDTFEERYEHRAKRRKTGGASDKVGGASTEGTRDSISEPL